MRRRETDRHVTEEGGGGERQTNTGKQKHYRPRGIERDRDRRREQETLRGRVTPMEDKTETGDKEKAGVAV